MFAISLVCPKMFNMQAYKHQQFYYVILDFAGIYVKGTVCWHATPVASDKLTITWKKGLSFWKRNLAV